MKAGGASSQKGFFSESEKGSITILTFGLFLITVALIFLITDVAAMVVAKRSLINATENAAIRASHALNREAYYQGQLGDGVPIDCQAARQLALEELAAWMQDGGDFRRPEIVRVELNNFSCFGDEIVLTTSAEASLPFVLPQSFLSHIQINATVGVRSKRIS
jgi:hypothetical protein